MKSGDRAELLCVFCPLFDVLLVCSGAGALPSFRASSVSWEAVDQTSDWNLGCLLQSLMSLIRVYWHWSVLVCGGMLDPIGLYNQQMEVLTLNFERAQRKCLQDATEKKNAPKIQRRSCNNGWRWWSDRFGSPGGDQPKTVRSAGISYIFWNTLDIIGLSRVVERYEECTWTHGVGAGDWCLPVSSVLRWESSGISGCACCRQIQGQGGKHGFRTERIGMQMTCSHKDKGYDKKCPHGGRRQE